MTDGLLAGPLPVGGDSSVQMSDGIIRITLQCGVKVRRRQIKFPDLQECCTAVEISHRRIGICFDGRSELANRGLEVTASERPNSLRKRSGGIRRPFETGGSRLSHGT